MLDSIPLAIDLLDKVPPYCTRCLQVPPTIRARHIETNHKEYICMECKVADKALRNVPIKPISAGHTSKLTEHTSKLTEQTINLVVQARAIDKIPPTCARCHQMEPKIRVHFKDHGFCDYICYHCKESDAFLRSLPVRPKERGFEFSSLFKNFSHGFIRV
jgi:predicted SprT family Zn-dependent metalloprotease